MGTRQPNLIEHIVEQTMALPKGDRELLVRSILASRLSDKGGDLLDLNAQLLEELSAALKDKIMDQLPDLLSKRLVGEKALEGTPRVVGLANVVNGVEAKSPEVGLVLAGGFISENVVNRSRYGHVQSKWEDGRDLLVGYRSAFLDRRPLSPEPELHWVPGTYSCLDHSSSGSRRNGDYKEPWREDWAQAFNAQTGETEYRIDPNAQEVSGVPTGFAPARFIGLAPTSIGSKPTRTERPKLSASAPYPTGGAYTH